MVGNEELVLADDSRAVLVGRLVVEIGSAVLGEFLSFYYYFIAT